MATDVAGFTLASAGEIDDTCLHGWHFNSQPPISSGSVSTKSDPI
jgi:hypothetical protein